MYPGIELELARMTVLCSDEEIVDTFTSLTGLLADPENWELGELDETSILAPVWREGGFTVHKYIFITEKA